MHITKEMSIIEVVQQHPATIEVFRKYGMGCFGCAAARFENIEQGATAHGIDVDALIVDLNKTVHSASGCCGAGEQGGCCGTHK
jgi:hybrid cluster-associated redox disulfide protein